MRTPRFATSFHRKIEITEGLAHALKNHFSGVLREVVGYLELQAQRNPDRFAFPEIEDIVEHCKRFKQPKSNYSLAWVKYALKEFRERGIISKRFQRWFDGDKIGKMRYGFYVAPVDALVVEEDGHFVFKGYDPARRPDWWVGKLQFFVSGQSSSRAGDRASSRASRPLSSRASSHPSSQVLSVEADDSKTVKNENRHLAFVSALTERTEITERAPSNPDSNSKGEAGPKTGASASESPFPSLETFSQEAKRRLAAIKKHEYCPEKMKEYPYLGDKLSRTDYCWYKGGKRLMLELCEYLDDDDIVNFLDVWAGDASSMWYGEPRRPPIDTFKGDWWRAFVEERIDLLAEKASDRVFEKTKIHKLESGSAEKKAALDAAKSVEDAVKAIKESIKHS